MKQLLGIVPFAALVASQCMVFKKSTRITPNKPGLLVNNSRLVDCIEECITNSRQRCYIIAFNDKSKTCRIVNGYNTKTSRGTVILKKLAYKSVDFQCFRPVAYSYEGLHYFYGIESEEECRRICILLTNCKGYTWWILIQRCGIQKRSQRSTTPLKDGEVSAAKQSPCNSNRCTFMGFNIYSNVGKMDRSVSTMFECYNQILQNKILMTFWNYAEKRCFTTEKAAESVIKNYDTIIRTTYYARMCNRKKPNVCVKRKPATKMEGGFPIANVAEQDCVTMCLNTVNCAAVTWSRDRTCRFHHVIRKTIKGNSTDTNYIIVECKKEGPMSSMVATHYTWQGSRPVQWKFSSSCFKCASLCQIRTCSGFTCDNSPDQCSFDEVIEHAYVSRK